MNNALFLFYAFLLTDKDIIMKLEEVHRRQREYTEKEKKIYAAMLNT